MLEQAEVPETPEVLEILVRLVTLVRQELQLPVCHIRSLVVQQEMVAMLGQEELPEMLVEQGLEVVVDQEDCQEPPDQLLLQMTLQDVL